MEHSTTAMSITTPRSRRSSLAYATPDSSYHDCRSPSASPSTFSLNVPPRPPPPSRSNSSMISLPAMTSLVEALIVKQTLPTERPLPPVPAGPSVFQRAKSSLATAWENVHFYIVFVWLAIQMQAIAVRDACVSTYRRTQQRASQQLTAWRRRRYEKKHPLRHVHVSRHTTPLNAPEVIVSGNGGIEVMATKAHLTGTVEGMIEYHVSC